MKAWAINKYGDNSNLKQMDLPAPKIQPNEVLISIRAASINPVDFKIRDGKLKLVVPYKMPLTLGNDCAGIITEIGSQVKKFKVGDEVYTRPHKDSIGTLAESIAAEESTVALKPKNLSFEEAASIPLIGLTAWQVFFDLGHLKKGDRVFIPAGSGGVGTFAIQLAKHYGAWVATNTSTRNLDFVRSLGADLVIDYTKEDFTKILSDIDLVFDTMGGSTQAKAFSILKKNSNAKMISIVGPPTMDLAKQAELPLPIQLGAYLLSLPALLRARKTNSSYQFHFMIPNGSQLEKIAALIENKKIKPNLDRVYPFHQANLALAHVESGRARGKVVVSMNASLQ